MIPPYRPDMIDEFKISSWKRAGSVRRSYTFHFAMRSCASYFRAYLLSLQFRGNYIKQIVSGGPLRNRCAIRVLKSAGVILSKFKAACSHHEITKGSWYRRVLK